MSEHIENYQLTSVSAFLKHLNDYKNRFFCPCCGSQRWGLNVMSIPLEMAAKKDGTPVTPEDGVDLDQVIPRFLQTALPDSIDGPGPMGILPVTCQECGYVAFFDAKIVAERDAKNG